MFSFSCNRALKKESIKVENLFKDSTGSRPTRVYIEGVAGIGKSSLCKKLAYSWSRAQGSGKVNYLSLSLPPSLFSTLMIQLSEG